MGNELKELRKGLSEIVNLFNKRNNCLVDIWTEKTRETMPCVGEVVVQYQVMVKIVEPDIETGIDYKEMIRKEIAKQNQNGNENTQKC